MVACVAYKWIHLFGAYHMSGTVLGIEEPNTVPTFSPSQTQKGSNKRSQFSAGGSGLQPPTQPLWILGPPSFLDLAPEWQEPVWDNRRLALLSFKGLLIPPVERKAGTGTGPTPSPVAASISGPITWEGPRANWRLVRLQGRPSHICSLYKTEPGVKHHTWQPPHQ